MRFLVRVLAIACLALVPADAGAVDGSIIAATLVVHADKSIAPVAPEIFGQFAEHLGAGMYGGLWVGPKSKIPNTRGFRKDVVGALRALQVPVVRWPGGCYADQYHWRDGIGAKRPVGVNTTWGGVEESNAVGTHEYMDLMAQLGSKAYIDSNVGTGSPRETEEWLEYLTSPSHSTLAEMRRKNGRDKPWHIDYFGFGNEPWGCGGNMRPEVYADLFHLYATFAKTPGDNTPVFIAAGPYDSEVQYTEALMASDVKAHQVGAITLHHYALPTGNWSAKGPATGFGEDQWMSTLKASLAIDGMIAAHSAVMDRYDPQKRVGLYVDEWGNWYDVEKGTNGAFLYQQDSLRDAITASLNFDIFQAHADRVRMSCIAQMVNVLQSLILTDGPRMVLTPTYHAYMMYKPFRGAMELSFDLVTPDYTLAKDSVAAIHAAVARKADGGLTVSLTNVDPNRPAHVAVTLPAMHAVTGRILTAAAMDAHNSFDHPDVVKPVPFSGAVLSGDRLEVDLPAKSLVVLELN